MNERGRSQMQVLHRPHLVLADARRPDDVARPAVSSWSVSRTSCGFSASPLDAVAERELVPPVGELAQPRLGTGQSARRVECAQLACEVGEHLLERADHGDVRLAELSDLCGVDVEVDDRRARRERRELARHAVVEAGADRDEEVALVQAPVRPLRAVHAGPAEVELVRLGERALAHERRHDREPPDLGELEQLGAGVRVERPAADVEHRLLGGCERGGGALDLARVPALRRLPARQVDLVGVREVELGLLDVARDVDEHRPAAPRARDVERRLDHVRKLLDVLHEPRVLDDRDRDRR